MEALQEAYDVTKEAAADGISSDDLLQVLENALAKVMAHRPPVEEEEEESEEDEDAGVYFQNEGNVTWDTEASCTEGLEFEGNTVKKNGADEPDFATALLPAGVRTATFRMVRVERAAVYIGVATPALSNSIGFGFSGADNLCWYLRNEGELRCGSDTMHPALADNASKFRTGDSLVVGIQHEEGAE